MIQDESHVFLKLMTKVCLWILVMSFSFSVQARLVEGSVTRMGDATNFEFRGLDQWNYDVDRKDPKKLVLTVPAFDTKTEVALKTWSDSFVESIEIQKNGADNRYQVIFHLADEKVENFDYLTDDPSRLILDFYRHVETADNAPAAPSAPASAAKPSTPTVAPKKAANLKKTSEKSDDYTRYEREARGERAPAGELDPRYDIFEEPTSIKGEFPKLGAFDGGDPNWDRFLLKDYEIKEEAIIASRQNFYIRFPMLKMPTSQLPEILANRPEYVIKKKDSKENKEAQLLLQLYNKKRVALFLKTYRYFTEKYPNSIYSEIVHHLAAEIHFDRYLKDKDLKAYEQAQAIYRMILKNYPDSPLAERTELILAYAELERGNGLLTLQNFQSFLEKHPQSEHNDHAQKAIAAGFLILNKYEDALKTYQSLSQSAKDPVQGIEAFYRLGDVHFQKRDYENSIKAYEVALKAHPEYESRFPNAHYNSAEAHFWMGNYKKALHHYVEYLKRFPAHSHGGYAMTRIGENLAILGADQRDVMGAFLESHFRYRDNPGAQVARVRMLSQQMRVMKDKELTKALGEINKIAETSELPRIKEFVTLMVAEGYDKRSEHEKAMNLLISYYQENPTSTDLNFFKKKILGSIAEVMEQKINEKNFIETLQFNGKYKNTWLRNSDRLDIPYFLGLAYEQAGVQQEAKKIYSSTLANLEKIRGTEEDKERRVTENIPTLDEVRMRLAKAQYDLREFQAAQDLLRQVNAKDLRTEQGKIEFVTLTADVSEQKGQIETAKAALNQLADSWRGQPNLLLPVLLRLSRLHFKGQEYVDAIQNIEKIESMRTEGLAVADSFWADTLELKGEVQEKQGKVLAAVETYLSLLDQFEAKRPLASVRYRAGGLLFDKGDISGAERVWQGLDAANDPMFSKLAQQRLADAKWQNDYKKYINRIPAMSDKK